MRPFPLSFYSIIDCTLLPTYLGCFLLIRCSMCFALLLHSQPSMIMIIICQLYWCSISALIPPSLRPHSLPPLPSSWTPLTLLQLNLILIFLSFFLLSETPHVDQRYPGSSPILSYRLRRSPDLRGKSHDKKIYSDSRCGIFLHLFVLAFLSPPLSFISRVPYSYCNPLSPFFTFPLPTRLLIFHPIFLCPLSHLAPLIP